MSPLKEYTKHLIVIRAHERICEDLKRAAIRELKKYGFAVTLNGVELTIAHRQDWTYSRAIQKRINKLTRTLALIKLGAKIDGKARSRIGATAIKGTIRKSVRKQVLGRVSAYAKHFGLR